VRPGGGSLEAVGTTMQEQTHQALKNVKAILEAAGSSLESVVQVTVLLARPDLYGSATRSRRVLFDVWRLDSIAKRFDNR
jgi:enamine deaminase RidA (YjgF/YER057c/UK114 family)